MNDDSVMTIDEFAARIKKLIVAAREHGLSDSAIAAGLQ
jgi:hypothetical protein